MRVPGYVFDRRLYQGSATVVYAGVREADGAAVVAKMVTGGVRDLGAEYEILRRLRGPGVAEAFGVFDSSEGPVLVQRRFGTQNLAETLAAGPLAPERALRIALSLAEVLARVHAARTLHRDIKPANVLYDPESGEIALADFGIAVELPVGARALPVRDLVGTPSYVAPEQTGRTHEGCDFRSDLYSLGVTLYQLTTGSLPFASRELLELISAHLSQVPEPPHVRNRALPPMLGAIVMKLIAKSPTERYQSARGLAADLGRCIEARAADGSIPAFELGRSDLKRPEIPTRLYGREREYKQLAGSYVQVSRGEPRLVLIAGREGAGRRALVQRLLAKHPKAPAAVGAFAQGGRPLAGISDALGTLAKRLLLLDDERLAAVRRGLAEHLGQVGKVVVDLAPALEDVLGAQPELPVLGLAEERARLRYAFSRLFSGLGQEHVCIFALASFEHADAASVSLVEALLEEGGARVLIVLSARDPSAFGALAQRPQATTVELGPLAPEAVAAWVAGALSMAVEQVADLASVLHDKSGGNPALLLSLLDHFVERGVIDRREGAYVWSLDAVRAEKAPPTMAALVSQRVAELPEGQRALLAGLAQAGQACDLESLGALMGGDTAEVARVLGALEREGLVTREAEGHAIAHPAIAHAALASVPSEQVRAQVARLASHLLRRVGQDAESADAFRLAKMLELGRPTLTGDERVAAARLYLRAGAEVTRGLAYDAAARFFALGEAQLDAQAAGSERDLAFALTIGRGRSLMMLGQNDLAEQAFKELCSRDLSPAEIGLAYQSRIDNRSVVADRFGAIDVGSEGLARLGIKLPPNPSAFKPLPLLFSNERKIAKQTERDHLVRPEVTDPRAVAALRILSTLTTPAFLSRRTNLYLLVSETAISLIMRYGHARQASGFLCTHSSVMLGGLRKYDKARHSYEACLALERERPAPELLGRTTLVLYYFLHSWFRPWKESADALEKGVQHAIEVGDPLFAALCASGAITLHTMSGTALDRVLHLYEAFGPAMRADKVLADSSVHAVRVLGKLVRGEPVAQGDLDPITAVPVEAGPMRNNLMVNLGLALLGLGHAGQVRAWLDNIRGTFAKVNFSQPQIATLWLLDGLLAADDAQRGARKRLRMAKRMLDTLRTLQKKTRTTHHEPAILLLEAEIARAHGALERASGLYGRAATQARAGELVQLVALAMERRAQMLGEAGEHEEAALFFRQAAIAYRRWGNLTKVRELESVHPELRALELSRGDPSQVGVEHPSVSVDASSHGTEGTCRTTSRTLNETLDLSTVLKVSQEISTQLYASDVVRSVLAGIAQNAGAERVLFILRDEQGRETVYGELLRGEYHGIHAPLESYEDAPASLLKLVRRTAKAVVVSDALAEAAHASDPFVARARCRSIATIPVVKKGRLSGYVLLENRLAPGAFTSQLIGLTQALVAQAAISLDNASLYEDMEQRVHERTAALHARNAEMRLVLDHVVQGLAIIDMTGRLSPETSAVLARWFPEGLPAYVGGFFRHDPKADFTFRAGWEQLTEGFLPLALCIDQLPKQLQKGGRTFAVSWEPIENDRGEVARMLVVLSDITEVLRAQEAEAEQRQQMALFQRLSTDQSGVVEFAKESSAIVREIESGKHPPEVERRLVHTLKGNAGLFGQTSVASLCHGLESTLIEEQRSLTPEERAQLGHAWGLVTSRLRPFLDVGEDVLRVRRADYELVLRALLRDGSRLAEDVELWRLEPLEQRFQRIAEQASQLAARLGKDPIDVQVDAAGVRTDPAVWAPFWSAFVHALRNAVDHGLEPRDERVLLGKGVGTLALRAYFSGASFVFELADDGRGIAWEKVRSRARAHGLPAETHEELVAALFRDGVSTKELADETSGRGVGMGALREACQMLQAKITVESAPGEGTTWRFIFPAQLAKQPRVRRSLRPSAFPTSN